MMIFRDNNTIIPDFIHDKLKEHIKQRLDDFQRSDTIPSRLVTPLEFKEVRRDALQHIDGKLMY